MNIKPSLWLAFMNTRASFALSPRYSPRVMISHTALINWPDCSKRLGETMEDSAN